MVRLVLAAILACPPGHVCRSELLEAQARSIVIAECPSCSRRRIRELIDTYQSMRGPKTTARELANDVLFGLGKRRYP